MGDVIYLHDYLNKRMARDSGFIQRFLQFSKHYRDVQQRIFALNAERDGSVEHRHLGGAEPAPRRRGFLGRLLGLL